MEITVVIGRFEDLAARGLRSLLAEQANIQVVAADVELDAFDAALTEHEPQVAIVNFGSLRTPVEVNRLHTAHPDHAPARPGEPADAVGVQPDAGLRRDRVPLEGDAGT